MRFIHLSALLLSIVIGFVKADTTLQNCIAYVEHVNIKLEPEGDAPRDAHTLMKEDIGGPYKDQIVLAAANIGELVSGDVYTLTRRGLLTVKDKSAHVRAIHWDDARQRFTYNLGGADTHWQYEKVGNVKKDKRLTLLSGEHLVLCQRHEKHVVLKKATTAELRDKACARTVIECDHVGYSGTPETDDS